MKTKGGLRARLFPTSLVKVVICLYLADCHTHTTVSLDSEAELRDMACAARTAGLSGLWVTDHFDLVDAAGQPVTDFDWPDAIARFDAVQSVPGFELHLGLELGSAPYDPAAAERVIAQAGDRLDFVLGSIHNWLGMCENMDFYCTSFHSPVLCRAAMDNALESTWSLVSRCPQCYDSLAHIVYPLRYMRRDGNPLSILDYEERVRDILKEVARSGHAMEVNTCRGRDVAIWAPVLGWFRECGGEYVTIGSDAHIPEDVGRGLGEAAALVREAGFPGITIYRGRRPVVCPWEGGAPC